MSEPTPKGAARANALKDAESPLDAVEKYRMPLMEHLRELRGRLVTSLVVVVLGICVGFVFAEDIFSWLVQPMNQALAEHGEGTMAITDPLEGVVTYLKVAFIAGLFFASPVVSYQIWAFVAPGLYSTEKRVVVPLFMTSTVLFSLGAAFGYYVIFKYGFAFFLSVITPGETAAVLSINAYLDTAIKLLVAFGLSFQLPIVIFFLARLGLVDARDLLVNFRYAIVIIFVVAAILTPPDVLTQTLMAGPLTVLYFLSIGVAWMFTTKKREKIAAP